MVCFHTLTDNYPLTQNRILPHRHLPETSPNPDLVQQLESFLRQQGEKNNLLLAPSIREGHSGLACYSSRPSTLPSFTNDRLHIHADSSLHVCIHPKDAALIVDRGWGVTFPLAGKPSPSGAIIDYGLVLLYAPRDEEDVRVVKEIVKAGIAYNLDCLALA